MNVNVVSYLLYFIYPYVYKSKDISGNIRKIDHVNDTRSKAETAAVNEVL